MTFTWDLASAPKPRDGKTHTAAYHIESAYASEGGTGDLFAANGRYLLCLDVPQPQGFSASVGHTAVVGAPTTAERPATFYEYYNAATAASVDARRMVLTNQLAGTHPIISVYPVPKITFSIREDLFPCVLHKTGANNVECRMSIQISITLLD